MIQNVDSGKEESVFSERARIGGTLVWYLTICARQVWLMARGIEPEPKHESLILGRLIDRNSYARERHQVDFGETRFDFFQKKDGRLVVCEVKKSSRSEAFARMQLGHYLYKLKKEGIDAVGELLFPAEKRRVEVTLTPELIAELDAVYEKICQITLLETPPPLVRCKYCAGCAFANYCLS